MSTTTALTTLPPAREKAGFMPVLTIEDAIERRNLMVELTRRVMVKDLDYGTIPGTDKPTLLKAGAEKLCTIFGLRTEKPEVVERVEDWTGKDHGGEPFFYYLIRQDLTRNGEVVASQMGSCNSREKKYRWRNADRACPQCGAAAIKRSKFPPRDDPGAQPGWYCYGKAGGCGANFAANDQSILGQQAGRIPNPDVADCVNAILKMAQKRAFVAAALVATNASEFFSHDIEDMEIVDAEYEPAQPRPQQQQKPAPQQQQPAGPDPNGPEKFQADAEARDAALAKGGIIPEGALLAEVERWARGKGLPEDLAAWTPPQVRDARRHLSVWVAEKTDESLRQSAAKEQELLEGAPR